MPLYDYECMDFECGRTFEVWMPVDRRDEHPKCPTCNEKGWRVFSPTVNILVPEHFRHNQRDFLPPKGDPAWAGIQMGGDSQMHSRPSAGEQLARELENA